MGKMVITYSGPPKKGHPLSVEQLYLQPSGLTGQDVVKSRKEAVATDNKIYRVVGFEEHKNTRCVTDNMTLGETHEHAALFQAKYGCASIEVLLQGRWQEYRGQKIEP